MSSRRAWRAGAAPRRSRRITRSMNRWKTRARSSRGMREFIVLSARMTTTGSASPHPIVAAVRRFVQTEVSPVATALEHADTYPHALVARMRELGLFGALIPLNYGGLGLAVTDYARVIEELCRGWMSLAGVINSHTMATLTVLHHGTDEQRQRFLP